MMGEGRFITVLVLLLPRTTTDGRVDTRFIRRRSYLYDIANGDFTLGRADETRPLGWKASEFAVFIIVDGVVAMLKVSRF